MRNGRRAGMVSRFARECSWIPSAFHDDTFAHFEWFGTNQENAGLALNPHFLQTRSRHMLSIVGFD